MAKVEAGSFTPFGTAPLTTTVLFNDSTILADEITFWIGPSGAGDNGCHIADGFMTPTRQRTRFTIFATNALLGKTGMNNTSCLTHYANTGSITKVVEGVRNSMATTGQFSIDWSTWTPGYQIYFIARQY